MEYQKTTGKVYDKSYKCEKCGKIFENSNICPECGSKDTKVFQRTLATIQEEVVNEKHN